MNLTKLIPFHLDEESFKELHGPAGNGWQSLVNSLYYLVCARRSIAEKCLTHTPVDSFK